MLDSKKAVTDRFQNTSKKVVKPVLFTGQKLGEQRDVLQGADIQELNSEIKPGQPVLKRVQRDTCVLIHGNNLQPLVACVREVVWNGAEVDLRIIELLRSKDYEGKGAVSSMRHVLYTNEVIAIPAKRVLHPCKVFFLPNDFEPVTMGVILGKQNLRPRPGHICWKTYNAATKEALPFDNIGQNAPEFHEIAQLVRKTHKELRRQEELENVPLNKRVGSLPSRFAEAALASEAFQPEGEADAGALSSAIPWSGNEAAEPANTAQGAADALTEPADAGSEPTELPAESTAGIVTNGKQDQALALQTSADGATEGKDGFLAEASKAGGSVAAEAASSEEREDAADPDHAASGHNTAENGAPPKAETALDADALEEAVQNLAMKLEVRVQGKGVLAGMENDVNLLIHHAGQLAEGLSRREDDTKDALKDLAAWKIMWKHVKLPLLASVQRLAKAFTSSLPGLQAQLVQLGLHRVFGAWLCSLPISGASTATVPLLRALAKVSCNEATLSWLHQQGVLEYVKELTNSEVSAVKERATALKVYWEDAAELGAEEESTGQAAVLITTPAADLLASPNMLAEHAEQLTDEGWQGLSRDFRRTSHSMDELGEGDAGATGNAAVTQNSSPCSHLPLQAASEENRTKVKGTGTPELGLQRKMRDLNELHKTSPSAQADSKTGAAAASPLPVPANHSVSQAFNVAENATTRSEGEIDNAEAENTTHARPAELSPKRTKQEPETKAKPAKLNNRERTSAGRAAPAAPSTHAHPEWSIAAIKALRDALSQEDLALLQSMRSSRAQLDLDVSVDGFVRQKMKEYGIADMLRAREEHDSSEQTPGVKRARLDQSSARPPKIRKTEAPPVTRSREKSASQTSADRASDKTAANVLREGKQTAPTESPKPDRGGPASESKTRSGSVSREALHSKQGGMQSEQSVRVYTGSGKRQKRGSFNMRTEMIMCENGTLTDPQQFVLRADRKTPWQQVIMVEGDKQGRSIGEWLTDRCSICDLPTDEANLLMCSNDKCERMYHIYCLTPPLTALPAEDEEWYCPQCQSQKSD